MDLKAAEIFKKMAQKGLEAFAMLREIASGGKAGNNKQLREWGITDAAEMLGKDPQHLRDLEKENKIPEARRVSKGNSTKRVYSLGEINMLREFFGTRPHKPVGCDPAIICVSNFKGGAGKTETAVSLAQAMALKGYRVLVVDLDSQASATYKFGYVPDEDLSQEETSLGLLLGEENADITDLIRETYWHGIDLLPANLSLYNAELILPTQFKSYAEEKGEHNQFYNRLNLSLQKIYPHYDVIVLDCPPSVGMISINALFAANALLIPTPPVLVDFSSTIQFFKMLGEVMERLPEKKYNFVRVMLTKYNGRSSAAQLKSMLNAFYNEFTLFNYMIESEAVSKAAANMETLFETHKFQNDKKTYRRAVMQAMKVNEEIEMLFKTVWEVQASMITPTREVTSDE